MAAVTVSDVVSLSATCSISDIWDRHAWLNGCPRGGQRLPGPRTWVANSPLHLLRYLLSSCGSRPSLRGWQDLAAGMTIDVLRHACLFCRRPSLSLQPPRLLRAIPGLTMKAVWLLETLPLQQKSRPWIRAAAVAAAALPAAGTASCRAGRRFPGRVRGRHRRPGPGAPSPGAAPRRTAAAGTAAPDAPAPHEHQLRSSQRATEFMYFYIIMFTSKWKK